MRSIVYCGHDFSEYCSAEVVARSASPVVAEALEVPGRAGALLVSGHVAPVEVNVKLFLDAGFAPDSVEMASIRHQLSFWLCEPGGGELVLPDEPGFVYREALLVDAGAWSKLFSDGSCEVAFMLFDPVAYGAERIERSGDFAVGGTWPTMPEFRLVADEGDALQVYCPALGKGVRVEQGFSGGEAVVVDCADGSVLVNGADARDLVTLGSDFFALRVGDCSLEFSGCTYFETRFHERWV